MPEVSLVIGPDWPPKKPRRPQWKRKAASFGAVGTKGKEPLAVNGALTRLEAELGRWGATNAEVSAAFATTRAGNPSRSEPNRSADPGCVLAFSVGKERYVMAVDTFGRLADNVAGLAAHLEATRAIERYGVVSAAEAMSAFKELPAPATGPWLILGVSPGDVEGAESRYRELAKKEHPDVGGDAGRMAAINEAILKIRAGVA